MTSCNVGVDLEGSCPRLVLTYKHTISLHVKHLLMLFSVTVRSKQSSKFTWKHGFNPGSGHKDAIFHIAKRVYISSVLGLFLTHFCEGSLTEKNKATYLIKLPNQIF